MLGDTVNEWAVRTLLECNLVQFSFCSLSFLSITAGKGTEDRMTGNLSTLFCKYSVKIPFRGVVKYYKFVFVQSGEAGHRGMVNRGQGQGQKEEITGAQKRGTSALGNGQSPELRR